MDEVSDGANQATDAATNQAKVAAPNQAAVIVPAERRTKRRGVGKRKAVINDILVNTFLV